MRSDTTLSTSVQSVAGGSAFTSGTIAAFVEANGQMISLTIAVLTFIVFLASTIWNAIQNKKRIKQDIVNDLIMEARLQNLPESDVDKIRTLAKKI
ncbi:hypothetical protein [Vibrio phage vB_VpaM_XM1]